MARYTYYREEETFAPLDLQIFNLNSIRWSEFQFTTEKQHIVLPDEVLKPYLISQIEYGTVEYEDVILLVNNIRNPFSLKVGQILRIPSLADIQTFFANR